MNKKINDKIIKFNEKKKNYKEQINIFSIFQVIIIILFLPGLFIGMFNCENDASFLKFFIIYAPTNLLLIFTNIKLIEKTDLKNKKAKEAAEILANQIFTYKDLDNICNNEIKLVKSRVQESFTNEEISIYARLNGNEFYYNIYFEDKNIYSILNNKIKEILDIELDEYSNEKTNLIINDSLLVMLNNYDLLDPKCVKDFNIKYNLPFGERKGNEITPFYRSVFKEIKKIQIIEDKKIIGVEYDSLDSFIEELIKKYKINDKLGKKVFKIIIYDFLKKILPEWINELNIHREFYENKLNFEKNTKSYSKSDFHYENHCWNCHASIDSEKNVQCGCCGWYICNSCGACSVREHQH